MSDDIKNPTILTIAGGFFFFGDLIESPQDGYLSLKNFAMFNSFNTDLGVPGLARGDKKARCELDRFAPGEVGTFPVHNCYAIMPSINLYKFSGTKCR